MDKFQQLERFSLYATDEALFLYSGTESGPALMSNVHRIYSG